jgi:hypothetical protein
MCDRARLASDYSEIKIRLKFASKAAAPLKLMLGCR